MAIHRLSWGGISVGSSMWISSVLWLLRPFLIWCWILRCITLYNCPTLCFLKPFWWSAGCRCSSSIWKVNFSKSFICQIGCLGREVMANQLGSRFHDFHAKISWMYVGKWWWWCCTASSAISNKGILFCSSIVIVYITLNYPQSPNKTVNIIYENRIEHPRRSGHTSKKSKSKKINVQIIAIYPSAN